MSRCKACDAQLFKKDTPSINPLNHKEEDLCGQCRGASQWAFVEHEYTGGLLPEEGVTLPKTTYDEC